VELAPKLQADGIAIRGVRIDSGDLSAMAKKVRGILDAGGLEDVIILVSGGINEDVLLKMAAAKAPIDGFGIGVNLDASIDAPSLDCAYKLQEYAGRPRRKLSEGKQTGRPQAGVASLRCACADARRCALARERQARWRSACRAGDAWRQARRAGADARGYSRPRQNMIWRDCRSRCAGWRPAPPIRGNLAKLKALAAEMDAKARS
jgi:nicotinate phosphoribosyltransferase